LPIDEGANMNSPSFWSSEQINALHETTLAVISQIDSGNLLEVIIRKAVELLHAKSGGIHIYFHERQELIFVANYNRPQEGYPMKLGEGIAGTLIEQYLEDKSTLYAIVDDYNDSEFRHSVYEDAGRHNPSVLKVLLRWEGFPLGVLYVDDVQGRKFTNQDAELLLLFGEHASIAWVKTNLVDQLKQIGAIATGIAQTTTLGEKEKTLQVIVNGIKEGLKAHAITLYTKDQFSGKLMSPPTHTELRYPKKLSEIRPVEAGFMYDLLRREQPYIVSDIRTDPYFNGKSFPIDEGIKSYIAVPLSARSEEVGLMFVSYHTVRQFLPDEINHIELFASQAAVAIHNEYLFERERKNSYLYKVVGRLSEKSDVLKTLNEIVKHALEIVSNPTKFEGEIFCYIVMVEDDSFKFITSSPIELLDEMKETLGEVDVREGICGYVVEQKRSINVPNVNEHPLYRRIRANVHSQLAVPIMDANKVLGVISIEHSLPSAFSNRDQQDLEFLAEIAAIAIENAHLFDEVRRNRDELNKAWNTAKQLTNIRISANISDTLLSVAEATKQAFECDVVTIFPYDSNTNTLTHRPVIAGNLFNPAELIGDRGLPPHSIVHDFVKRISPYIAEDVENDSVFKDTRFAKVEHIKSSIAIPLSLEHVVVGVMFINYRTHILGLIEDNVIAASTIDLFANQAAMVIHHAHLHDHLNTRVDALRLMHEISNQIINAHNLNQVLQKIVTGSRLLLEASISVIYLINPTGQSLGTNLQSAYMEPEDNTYPQPRWDNPEISLTSYIVKSTEHIVISDLQSPPSNFQPNTELVKLGYRSLIGIPLIPLQQNREVIGVLFLTYRNIREFTHEEISLLQTLANQSATIIQIRRTQETTRRVLSRMRALHKISKSLYTASGEEEILKHIVLKEILKTFRFDYAAISLIEGHSKITTKYIVAAPDSNIDVGWINLSSYSIDDKDIIADVYRKNEPEIIDGFDSRLNEKIFYQFNHQRLVRAYLPIPSATGTIGVMEVGYDKSRGKTIFVHDLEDLRSFLDQTVLALGNIENIERLEQRTKQLEKLGKEVEKRNSQLESLRSIAQQTVGDLTNPKDVLQQVSDSIQTLFEAHSVVVIPFDGKRFVNEWRVVSPSELAEKHHIGEPRETGITIAIFEQGMIDIRDVSDEQTYPFLVKSRFVAESEIKSYIGVRMRHSNENTGVIFVNFAQRRELSNEEKGFLKDFADFVGGIVRTAVTISDLTKLVNLDYSIYRAVDRTLILQYLLTDINTLIPNDQCTIWLVDNVEDPKYLSPELIEGRHYDKLRDMILNVGEGIIGSIVAKRSRDIEIVEAVAEDPRVKHIPGTPIDEKQTMICAPIFVDNNVMGVISLSRYKLGNFDERRDTALLQIIVDRATVALYIGELVTELRQQKTVLDDTFQAILTERGERFAGRLFYNIVAHDVRNILSELNALLRGIKSKKLSQADRRDLDTVVQRIESGSRTILEFINLTQNITTAKEWHDINSIIRRAAGLMEIRFSQREIEYISNLSRDIPLIKVNYTQILEIILNIYSNALKAMSASTKRELTVETFILQSEDVLVIRIGDTGIGIRNEHKDLIFERIHSWWPKDSDATGTGIGLKVTKDIMDEHSGSIRFDTQVGQGTTFILKFPLT
jgi:GAF domain-containing protein